MEKTPEMYEEELYDLKTNLYNLQYDYENCLESLKLKTQQYDDLLSSSHDVLWFQDRIDKLESKIRDLEYKCDSYKSKMENAIKEEDAIREKFHTISRLSDNDRIRLNARSYTKNLLPCFLITLGFIVVLAILVEIFHFQFHEISGYYMLVCTFCTIGYIYPLIKEAFSTY